MTDDEGEFDEICGRIPKIQALHAEAVRLAPSLGGDYESIKRVWRGKSGLQARIAEALEEAVGLADERRFNRLYDEACKASWRVLNGRD